MQPIRKILVWVSHDSSAQDIVRHALRLAKRYGATLRLVGVVDELPWYTRLLLPSADELQGLLVESRLKAVEQLAASVQKEGVPASVAVLRGRPALEVVREVLREKHDLVLKVAESRAGGGFHSCDLHLLRDCPCPVWLIHPERAQSTAVTKMLAAVDPPLAPAATDTLNLDIKHREDGSQLDQQILELASSLAAAESCPLHVVHAWSVPGEALLTGESTLGRDDILAYVDSIRNAHQESLDRLLSQFPAVRASDAVHVWKGNAADVIIDVAESGGVDLIVMGTIVRTGIPGLLMGNTAETVFRRVGCSVLAVKPEGFQSPVEPA